MGRPYIERYLALRAELREILGGLVGAAPELVALTASTTDSCNVVLAGLDIGPSDEIVTTTDEHFGLIGPIHTSGARVVVVPPDPDEIAAAVGPRTQLIAISQVLWTTGAVLPVRESERAPAFRSWWTGSIRGRHPGQRRRARLSDDLGSEMVVRAGGNGRARRRRPGAARVARPSYFSQESYDADGASCHNLAQGDSTRTGFRRRRSPGSVPRSRRIPNGASSGGRNGRALPRAARCRGPGRRHAE